MSETSNLTLEQQFAVDFLKTARAKKGITTAELLKEVDIFLASMTPRGVRIEAAIKALQNARSQFSYLFAEETFTPELKPLFAANDAYLRAIGRDWPWDGSSVDAQPKSSSLPEGYVTK